MQVLTAVVVVLRSVVSSICVSTRAELITTHTDSTASVRRGSVVWWGRRASAWAGRHHAPTPLIILIPPSATLTTDAVKVVVPRFRGVRSSGATTASSAAVEIDSYPSATSATTTTSIPVTCTVGVGRAVVLIQLRTAALVFHLHHGVMRGACTTAEAGATTRPPSDTTVYGTALSSSR